MTDVEHKEKIVTLARSLNDAMNLAARDGVTTELAIIDRPSTFSVNKEARHPIIQPTVMRVL